MPFGIGKKGHGGDGKPEFEPTEAQRAFLEPFFADPGAAYMDVKRQIEITDGISPEIVGKLGEWYREERSRRIGGAAGAERK